MCAVVRKGAPEAGTVIISVRLGAERFRLYGAPPGPAYDEFGERRWLPLLEGRQLTQAEVDDYLARQLGFDPDIWLVEIEDPDGTGLLSLSPAD